MSGGWGKLLSFVNLFICQLIWESSYATEEALPQNYLQKHTLPYSKGVHDKETSAAGKLSPCKKAPERMLNGQVDTVQGAEEVQAFYSPVSVELQWRDRRVQVYKTVTF